MKEDIKDRVAKINRGEVPEGYKKTDFGIFPCDWETDKTLGDLFSFTGGLGKSREELSEKGIPYLHYGDMHRDDANVVSFEKYSRLPKWDGVISGEEGYLMDDGDVAFLDASEDLEGTSRAVLIENPDDLPFIAGLHIILGKPTGNELHKSFRQYISRPEYARKQFQKLASGFKVYGINRNTITKIKLAYPKSINEQNRIAGILHKWDEAISLYKRQINALEEYKRICFSKMFPQKNKAVPEWRFEGCFGNWEYKRLGDISISFSGGTPRVGVPEFYGGRIPFIRSAEINSDTTELSITELGLNYSSARFVSKGDILFALYGATSGEVGRSKINGAINQAILAIKPLDSYDSEYIMQWLRKNKQNIIDTYLQGGQGNLSGTIVKNIPIAVPSLMEQLRIGSFFAHLDTLIALYRNKQEKVIIQKEIIQGFLLNGIVRV